MTQINVSIQVYPNFSLAPIECSVKKPVISDFVVLGFVNIVP